MRLIACLAIASVLGGCSSPPARTAGPSAVSPTPGPSPSPSPSPEPLVFPLDRAMAHIRSLSVDIGERASGSPGETSAAAHLHTQMSAAGLDVRRQDFTRADGGVSQNIIARLPGADYSTGFILLGAHYDTVPTSPGGNDNASGSGVLVALAEILADRRVPVEFVHFAAEEIHPASKQHHEGSRAYVDQLSDKGAVQAVISVDMIGKGPRHLIVQDRRHPTPLQQEVADVATALGIPQAKRSMGAVSDHTSFTEAGIPGILLWSGRVPEYHTAADTFDTVQPDAVDRAGRLLLEWLKRRLGVGP